MVSLSHSGYRPPVNQSGREEDLFAAYRERTQVQPPLSLRGQIREHLSRSQLVLPGVALTCLASSVGLAALATLLLSQSVGTPESSRHDPPPLFGPSSGDLFQATGRSSSR